MLGRHFGASRFVWRGDPVSHAPSSRHRGNKTALPSKPCAVCGRAMTWRKAWAKNWDTVRYCSEGCRRRRNAGVGPHP
ncbi:MAG: DUF2256 domain-containing protein [Gammaproteobacteria bacterium]|nr:DUF2256 domain-containing protein [Gammaproteobacteria bacterium]